jgi:hypothetical protein
MPYAHSPRNLKWTGHELRLWSGRLLATVKPDPDWPGMWRAHMADGHVTDMVNLSRAKDAAGALALAALDPRQKKQPRRAA